MKKIAKMLLLALIAFVPSIALACGGVPEQPPVYLRRDNYIYFGMFPQTVKSADVSVLAEPGVDGFFEGSDGGKYIKFTCDLNATTYKRSYKTLSDETTLVNGQDYYFKLEPIKWRILSEENDEALLLCDSIIGGITWQPYAAQPSGSNNYIINLNAASFDEGYAAYLESMNLNKTNYLDQSIFANNYEFSYARYYLNNVFYQNAFNSDEREIVLTSDIGEYQGDDYVFMLSHDEIINSDYGFNADSNAQDAMRQLRPTDYAMISGVYTYENDDKCGYYWLRSPSVPTTDKHASVQVVTSTGQQLGGRDVRNKENGLVAAIKIKLK